MHSLDGRISMPTLKSKMEDDIDAGYESLPTIERMLTSIECIGVEKRTKPSKHHVYVLVVCWSDGVKYPVYRRYISMFDLKIRLSEEFKDKPGFKAPELPALKLFERGLLFGHKDTAMEKRKRYINKFSEQVLNLPEEMVRSRAVVSFYETWESDFDNESSQRKGPTPAASPEPLGEHQRPLSGRHMTQPRLVFNRCQNKNIPAHAETMHNRPRYSHVPGQEGLLHMFPFPSAYYANSRSLPRGAMMDNNSESLHKSKYRTTCNFTRRRPGEVDLKEEQPVEVLKKNTTGSESEGHSEDDLDAAYETMCVHNATSEADLSCTRGQQLHITTATLDGWWKARHSSGGQGSIHATNPQRTQEQPEVKKVKACTTFQARSLRARCPPPRSQQGREAPRPGATTRNPNADQWHAQVRKPPKPAVTSSSPGRGETQATPGSPGNRPGPHIVLGEESEPQLNYAKVLFSDVDDPSRFVERQRQRQKYAVEYAEINPKPLPKVGAHKAKPPMGQGPSQIHSGAAARPELSVAPTVTPAQSQSGGVPSPETGKTGDVRPPQPVPRLRGRVAKQQALPNYENTTPLIARQPPHHARLPPDPNRPTLEKLDTTRVITGSPKQSPRSSIEVPSESPQGVHFQKVTKPIPQASAELSQGKPDIQVPREGVEERHLFNYENHAIAFINDFLRSSNIDQLSQPASSLQRKHATKMDAASAAINLGSNLDTIMVKLPQPPSYPAPPLPPDVAMWWTPPYAAESNMIEASEDYVCKKSDIDSVLSFKKGDLSVLVQKRDPNGWLGVKLGDEIGWVPSQYWAAHQPKPPKGHSPQRKMNIKQVEALHEHKAWFVGMISRQDSEDMLLKYGKQRNFLIRESTNRLGDLTLSMRYNGRIRHFPIQMTPTGKYDIGKAHFVNLTNVVTYYQENPLFFDEDDNNAPVSLGQPINRPKNA